jgi:hypothetical protein
VFLDADKNPIIFVPRKGLSGVNLKVTSSGGTKTYASPNQTIVGPGKRLVTLPDNTTANLGPPFFAAAGPDGDFTAGDDNKYSFE